MFQFADKAKGDPAVSYKPVVRVRNPLPLTHILPLPLTLMATVSPHLPLELLEEVISQAWHLQLALNERVLLMTSLPLVSRCALAAYLRVSSIHVCIPTPSYADKFIHSLRGNALQFPIQRSMNQIVELCRSITFEIAQQSPTFRPLHWTTEPPMGVALSDFLYNLRLFGDLPNFRTLTLRYTDVDLNDIFDWARFIDFPKTVEWLNLEFVQTQTDVPPPKIVVTPPGRSPHVSLWTLPFLRHLKVLGGSDELVSRLVSAMPNLETVRHGK